MNNNNSSGKKKLEKTKKPLKKFKAGSEYGNIETRLDPYDRKNISIRDIADLIEPEDFAEDNNFDE